MVATAGGVGTHGVIDLAGLGRLIASLQSRGYEVIGPQIRDGAVVYDTLEKVDDLPAGWSDEQAPGRYRLKRNGASSVFCYTVGPHTWKRFLHPPQVRLTQIQRQGQDLRILGDAEG